MFSDGERQSMTRKVDRCARETDCASYRLHSLPSELTAKVLSAPVAVPLPVPSVASEAVAPKKRRGKMATAIAEQMEQLAVDHPDLSRKKLKQMAVNRIRKMQAEIWRDYTTNGHTATGGAS
jgi:hypothetical protein